MDAHPHILLIDDNRAWRETLSEYLRSKGFAVLAAPDAARGLAVLRQDRDITLVLCDYHMPGMDGLELLRQLRGQPRSVAVLLLSSDEGPGLAGRALEEGARAVLSKTTAPGVLVRQIQQLMEKLGTLVRVAELPLWQRLLPSPAKATQRRNHNRPAAMSHRPGCSARRPA
jgi:two-component system chemotaxis response regulator CheY